MKPKLLLTGMLLVLPAVPVQAADPAVGKSLVDNGGARRIAEAIIRMQATGRRVALWRRKNRHPTGRGLS